ncbi:hypothetical protein NFI96_017886 [Prochilodus magdalenae]|nr:hypothetical protein NFI96_017886 [Prochilodus magdalenae]
MAVSLICCNTQSRRSVTRPKHAGVDRFLVVSLRVSSVLNRDVKQFGKKFMFDSNEETCWNSDQGDQQWVLLEFPVSVKVSELRLQFQGGFSGKSCKLQAVRNSNNVASSERPDAFLTILLYKPVVGYKHIKSLIYHIYYIFKPSRKIDKFCFPIQDAPLVQKLKIVFESSTDFFGRIIVYSLDVLGERAL